MASGSYGGTVLDVLGLAVRVVVNPYSARPTMTLLHTTLRLTRSGADTQEFLACETIRCWTERG